MIVIRDFGPVVFVVIVVMGALIGYLVVRRATRAALVGRCEVPGDATHSPKGLTLHRRPDCSDPGGGPVRVGHRPYAAAARGPLRFPSAPARRRGRCERSGEASVKLPTGRSFTCLGRNATWQGTQSRLMT